MVAIPSALPALRAACAAGFGDGRDRVEEEVVALFDEFRDRLLRYLLSFGLTIPDGEEVIQEVFLSLFQHLQRGGQRNSLRGWLFRVAHNLALKRRYRTRRDLEVLTETRAYDLGIDPAPNPEPKV